MRVAYFDHTAALGGGEIALSRTLPYLRQADPVVLAAVDGPLVRQLERDGIEVRVMGLDPKLMSMRRADAVKVWPVVRAIWRLIRAVSVVAKAVRDVEPDLLHTNSLKANVIGGVAGRIARVPVVWHVRDRLAPDYLPRAAVGALRLASRVLPAAVVVDSQSVEETLPKGANVWRIPSPIGGPPPPYVLRRNSQLIVSMVGRISPWKGQDVFLRAADAAFSSRADVLCQIIGAPLFGEERYEGELRGLARLTSLRQVEFLGHRNDVDDLLVASDIAVHASRTPEPFGLSVVEAMAAGSAVIASNAGGPAEVVVHGQNGLLVTPGEPDELAEALSLLAGDPEMRERLGRSAREAAKQYVPERCAARLIELYQSLLERGSS